MGISQPIESTTVGEYCNTATVQGVLGGEWEGLNISPNEDTVCHEVKAPKCDDLDNNII